MRNLWAPNPDFAPIEELVVVVGGCGHVGLPFAVACSETYNTVGLDIDQKKVDLLNSGKVPFVEHGIEQQLDYSLNSSRSLHFSTEKGWLRKAKFIVISIGTPIDEENNPRQDDLMNFIDEFIKIRQDDFSGVEYRYPKEVFLILRSTVSPGTTDQILSKLWSKNLGIYVAFCPERVIQGHAYQELKTLPQIIGTSWGKGTFEASIYEEFFHSIGVREVVHMNSPEAELAKLVTNMTRYVEFALANEFYILADKFDVDIHKVISGAKKGYPRLKGLALPGPNVGGPCLFKDGKFLLKNAPFNGLISTAFTINESMPQYIFDKAIDFHDMCMGSGNVPTIGIMGMTFKANNDDIRNSLSFKLKKIARAEGYNVITHDPFLGDSDDKMKLIRGCDIIFIMTPHDWYIEHYDITKYLRDGTIVVDPWKLYPTSRESQDGIWQVYRKENE
jgi:UDP-N-acetyl-D-mannosaminuronic acid dehydrogenase